jgi:hypothetical protein
MKDGRGRNNDVKLNVRNDSLVELDCGSGGVHFDRHTVGASKGVELIMTEINGFRVVRLERRPPQTRLPERRSLEGRKKPRTVLITRLMNLSKLE